jgi:hypothetical protein
MSRPAPEYGEYATPEEVAAITGRPVEAPALPVDAPVAAGEQELAEAERAGSGDADPEPEAKPARPVWDTALTIALLAAGAWNAFGSVADPTSFGRSLQESARTLGYTGDLSGGATPAIGVGIAIVSASLVVLCAVLSLRAAPRFRRIFWIPLSGAVLSSIAFVVGSVLVMLGHPDFAQAVLHG